MRSAIAAARFCAAAFVPLLVSGCSDAPTGPKGPPYLAIVTNLTTWKGASAPARVRYIVRDLINPTAPITVIDAAPKDTTILSLRPSDYVVVADSLPERCVIPRGGNQQGITLLDSDNTGIIRWAIECRTLVSLAVLTDGVQIDKEFIYRVRGASGAEFKGVIAANDTISFDQLTTGDVQIDIAGVADNCTVTNDGGTRQSLKVERTGGAAVAFRVVCSDPAHRPQILSFVSGYDLGAGILTFTVYDPDRDVQSYSFDLTDCQGNSILPQQRERVRTNLRAGRGVASGDTMTVVGGFEFGYPPAEMKGRCAELRVVDAATNVSRIAEYKLGFSSGSPPFSRFFNASLVDLNFITSTLEVNDPDTDIVGVFVLVRTRDGVFAPPDGADDFASMDPIGYLGVQVPLIPTTGRMKWDDVYSVIVYIIDAKGNVTRIEDSDTLK